MSAPALARRRTRRATPSPTWCSSPWRASSCRTPSTSARRRRARRCARTSRSPSDSAACSPRSSAGCRRRSRSASRARSAATTHASSGSALLKGYFGHTSDEPVTYVNAPQIAKDRGVDVREVNSTTSSDYVNLVTVRGAGTR
ncbi:MAG: hypothetical protein WKF58_03895 [Ilumatobacteraceae bacterium]